MLSRDDCYKINQIPMKRLENLKEPKIQEDKEVPAEDYLNNWEELIDD